MGLLTIRHRLFLWLAVCAAAVTWPQAPDAQGGLPGAPTNLQVAVSGTTLSITWGPPATGGAATNYLLIARRPTGEVFASQNVWPTPSFVSAVPHGVYVISVRAQNGAGFGPETAQQTVVVPAAPPGGPGSPGAPTNLQVNVSGTTLSASWGAPASGGAPTGYLLIARNLSGTVIAQQPVWPTPSFISSVPHGVYVVSVRASNAAGAGPETSPITVSVPSTPPGTGVPGAPTNLTVSVSGPTLSLMWDPPASGGPVTGYTVVGRNTLGAVIATANVGNSTSFIGAVPNGEYMISVYASNAGGNGPESTPRAATVPTPLAPPGAPRSFSATASGSSVTFAWLPPDNGGAVQSYAVRVSTSAGGPVVTTLSVAGTLTQTSVPGVPTGTYFATVVATNAAGTGPASGSASVNVGPPSTSRSTLNPPGVPASIEAMSSQVFGPGLPPTQTFDDFTFVGGSTVRQIAWQGIYCVEQDNAPAPSATATSFIIGIYPNQNNRPNVTSPIATTTVAVAQVNQTFNGNFQNATCGTASNTTWALYSYTLTLPAGFTAAPGVRYWFSVQAVTPSAAVHWGWRRGTVDTNSSLQLFNNTFIQTNLDRAFSMAP